MDVGEFICFDPIFDQSTKVTLKSISGMSSFKYFVQFKICSHYLYTVEKYVLDMRFFLCPQQPINVTVWWTLRGVDPGMDNYAGESVSN